MREAVERAGDAVGVGRVVIASDVVFLPAQGEERRVRRWAVVRGWSSRPMSWSRP